MTRPRVPCGKALTIGITNPSRVYYGSKYTALKGAENDARAMFDLASKRGFKCTSLLGSSATLKRVTSQISRAAKSLVAGDLFLLSFSGHGGAISPTWIDNLEPRPPSVEPDEWVQTWVLFDRELLDKELRTIWTTFKPGVRILVVLDSCHSYSSIEFEERRSRLFPQKLQQAVLDCDGEYYAGKLQESLPRARAQALTGARILSLAACQDDQLADDGDQFGLFTEVLLSVWSSKAWNDYCSFFHEVQKEVLRRNSDQNPGLLAYPDQDSFIDQPPFQIK